MTHPSQNSSVFVRNQLHWIILITTSMFYYLPSIQMVMHSSNLYKDTGNQDYCYYCIVGVVAEDDVSGNIS